MSEIKCILYYPTGDIFSSGSVLETSLHLFYFNTSLTFKKCISNKKLKYIKDSFY